MEPSRGAPPKGREPRGGNTLNERHGPSKRRSANWSAAARPRGKSGRQVTRRSAGGRSHPPEHRADGKQSRRAVRARRSVAAEPPGGFLRKGSPVPVGRIAGELKGGALNDRQDRPKGARHGGDAGRQTPRAEGRRQRRRQTDSKGGMGRAPEIQGPGESKGLVQQEGARESEGPESTREEASRGRGQPRRAVSLPASPNRPTAMHRMDATREHDPWNEPCDAWKKNKKGTRTR